MTSNNKKQFSWDKGGVLDDDNTQPINEVRRQGLSKLSKALHADPKKRKEEREEILVKVQSKPYKPKTVSPEEQRFIMEESSSGISGDIESSAAKKLIDKGSKFKGLDRFGKKK